MKKRRITTVIGFLKAVRDTIDAGWTQSATARDKHSHYVNGVDDPRAARFCLTGAFRRIELESPLVTTALLNEANRLLQHAAYKESGGSIIKFNDTRGRKKSEVLAMIDTAIKNVKAAA